MRRIFVDDVREIRASRVLRHYGAALSAVHVFTFIFFAFRKAVPKMLLNRADVVCWPYFEDCEVFATLGEPFWWGFLHTYLIFALAAGVMFFRERLVPLAYVLLIACTLLMSFVMIQDYRLMGNYHYMPYFSMFAFILLPAKREVARYIIVGFYVGAGLLKFNAEWLSGEGMIRPPVVSGKLLELLCAYVVLLETVISFGLLAKRRWIFWGAFAQFAAFHAFSWHIVGFFYPCVMGSLLSIFVLDRLSPPPEPEPEPEAATRRPHLRPSHVLFLGAFALFQLIPHFFPGDSAITGEGRLFSLNMFDAKALCESSFIAREGNTHIEISRPSNPLGVRIRCDPIVFLSWANTVCAENRRRPGFELDVFVVSKRTTDAIYKPLIATESFCAKRPDYDVLEHNEWILP